MSTPGMVRTPTNLRSHDYQPGRSAAGRTTPRMEYLRKRCSSAMGYTYRTSDTRQSCRAVSICRAIRKLCLKGSRVTSSDRTRYATQRTARWPHPHLRPSSYRLRVLRRLTLAESFACALREPTCAVPALPWLIPPTAPQAQSLWQHQNNLKHRSTYSQPPRAALPSLVRAMLQFGAAWTLLQTHGLPFGA